MADKNSRNPRKVTPAGIAKYPRLRVGDPDTKFVPEGEYHTKLLLDPGTKDTQDLMQYLDGAVDAAVAEMKQENPKFARQIKRADAYKMELDDNGDETGMLELAFKMPAEVTAKKGKNAGKTYTFTPALFDAKGQPLGGDVKIGGGSTVKVSFEHWPYFSAKDKVAGITRRLVAVQVITLKEYQGGQDAAGYGFGEEEGYSAEEHTPFAKASQGADDAATEEGAGDF